MTPKQISSKRKFINCRAIWQKHTEQKKWLFNIPGLADRNSVHRTDGREEIQSGADLRNLLKSNQAARVQPRIIYEFCAHTERGIERERDGEIECSKNQWRAALASGPSPPQGNWPPIELGLRERERNGDSAPPRFQPPMSASPPLCHA